MIMPELPDAHATASSTPLSGTNSSETSKFQPSVVTALSKVQYALTSISPNKKNAFLKYEYADLAKVMDALRPLLKDADLVVHQSPSTGFYDQKFYVRITTHVIHAETGHALTSSVSIPVKDATNPRDVGAAITYLRRYAIACMFGIVTDEDKDGETSLNERQYSSSPSPAKAKPAQKKTEAIDDEPPKGMLTKEDAAEVFELAKNACKHTGATVKKVLKEYYNVEKLTAVPEALKNELIKKLTSKEVFETVGKGE